MEKLTPELIKSFESGFHTTSTPLKKSSGFYITFKGTPFAEGGKLKVLATTGAAKRFLHDWIVQIFRTGEYWQTYKDNLKNRTGYEVDFSGTIAIMPSYGKTDRFYTKEFKEMVNGYYEALIHEGIININPVTI
jgi:hypothetical protein